MANQFTGQIYEISADLTEPLVIENFDITKDAVQLVGAAAAYSIETVDGNVQISTPEGTLLATITGVTELSPYAGYNPPEASYLVSLENEFFDTYVESYFFEPIYPVQNPDVEELIAAGEYTSYYDHFLKAGQFELREDTFLAGTDGDDTMYSVGYETVLVGVPITKAQYREGIDVVATDLGTGQVDTLYGGAGKEAIFVLGNSDIFNETAQSFYVGEGEADYALIKDFTSGDRIFLGSDAAGFTQEVVDGSTQISKDGDLIAIVEGVTELAVREDDNKELVAADTQTPTAAYTKGTTGDDVIYTNDRQGEAIAVPVTTTEDGTVVASSTGVGEFDTIYDSRGVFSYYLGFRTVDSPDTPQSLYVGNGDEDYALIKNYDPIADKGIYLAGKIDDYELEVVDGNTRISKDGDLISVVENTTLIPEFEDEGYTLVFSAEDEVYDETLKPYFNETLYLENNPDVQTAIAAGEYESGYEHFLQVGLLEGRYGFYNGTDGNDEVFGAYGVGNSYVSGVPLTGFDPATEQFTTDSTGTGAIDNLSGGVLTNKFILGSNGQPFYVGNGDEDYAIIGANISGFDPLKDFIYAAGSFSDYTVETVEVPIEESSAEMQTNTNISYQGDLVAVLSGVEVTLEEYSLGQDDAFAFVSPENTGLEPDAASPFTGETYEISADLTEPLVIDNFDLTKDAVQLAGAFGDYTLETVDGNLNISKGETLVATITGVAELKQFTGSTPEDSTYLVSTGNEFFSTYAEPYFYEDIYPVQNPDVDELIASGQYTSYYDHFLKAGQFEEREDTFFIGTEGNDTLYALGYETVLVGVPIEDAVYRPSIDVVPSSLGEGEIDTLYGGNTFEAIYVLGSSNLLNETPQAFYMGQGDADYALIKDFSPNDIIRLGDDTTKFSQEVVDGNLEISKDGDLIAIVENNTELLVTAGDEGYNLVNAQAFIEGTAEDDTIALSGTDVDGRAIGVDLVINEKYQQVATSNGTGEVDTFNFVDTEAANYIYLGYVTENSPDTPETFYLGNGDADYALIQNVNGVLDYPVLVPGKFEDYEVEIVDGDTRISKDGDLVAIIEDDVFVPENEADGYLNLYSAESQFYVDNSQPFFNENIYLANNPDAADAVAADQYASGFEHFMKVGLLEGRYAYYGGTSGDDGISAIGNSYVLGVPITEFDAKTEQFTTETTGTGEVDGLTGTVGINKFILGGNGESFYLGEGAEDYATIGGFDLLKDYLFLGGTFEDYSLETVEGNLNISKDGDLVSVVEGIESLEVYSGETPEGGFYLVGGEAEPQPTEPTTPIFGTTDGDTLNVTDKNQLVFAGGGNDLVDATASQSGNRIYGASGDDTFILGQGDSLIGDTGSDRFFVQTGGDNLLTGGAGADQFWLASAETPQSLNTVTDFTLGEDVLGIGGLGASFDSLTLTQQGENTLIAFDGNDLALLNQIQASSLTASNFAFA
jgi:Ca2+-binding RTX toxin-like protein